MSRQRSFRVHDQTIHLSERQFRIATAFFMNTGRVLTRDHISSLVWGHPVLMHSRRIDTHVYLVRDKLRLDGKHGLHLLTVYGVGYRLAMVDE
jgi:two-component system response regulator RegX3